MPEVLSVSLDFEDQYNFVFTFENQEGAETIQTMT